MRRELDYEVIRTFRPFFDRKHDYLILKVGIISFCCRQERFEEYILNCPEEHWQKVEDWIDSKIMPYMTRKSVNYDRDSSYSLKDKCERDIGYYVAEELVLYILASKGVSSENHKSIRLIPTTMYYPLSSKFDAYQYKRRTV